MVTPSDDEVVAFHERAMEAEIGGSGPRPSMLAWVAFDRPYCRAVKLWEAVREAIGR